MGETFEKVSPTPPSKLFADFLWLCEPFLSALQWDSCEVKQTTRVANIKSGLPDLMFGPMPQRPYCANRFNGRVNGYGQIVSAESE